MTDDEALFSVASLREVQPARLRPKTKLSKRREVGFAAAADPQPDPGRYQMAGTHLLKVSLSDEAGNDLGVHTATCVTCSWTQEKFEVGYEERRAWSEAFTHAGIDWSGRRVLVEPPFEEDGKGNAQYLADIEQHYGEVEGPYLLITQNCQQSNELPNGEDAAHNCVGIVFGRGDGEADDRIGLCADGCHSELELRPRLCGGLQDNGCTELATKPDGLDVPDWWEQGEKLREARELVLCDTHWLATRSARLTTPIEVGSRRGLGMPQWRDPAYLLQLQTSASDPLRHQAGFRAQDLEKVRLAEAAAFAAAFGETPALPIPEAKAPGKPSAEKAARSAPEIAVAPEPQAPPPPPSAGPTDPIHRTSVNPKTDQIGWDFSF